MLLGAALPLEVDRHEVGAGGDEEPDDLAPEARVAHRLRDLAEHAATRRRCRPEALRSPSAASASSIITATGFIARRRLRIFSRLPSVTPCHWRAEVLQLHHRDPDLAGEAGDEERLARADRPGDEVAHRHHVGAALLDGAGGVAEVRFGLGVPGHHVERVVGLDELQQAVGLGLDQLLLPLGEPLEGEAAAVLEHVGEDRCGAGRSRARPCSGRAADWLTSLSFVNVLGRGRCGASTSTNARAARPRPGCRSGSPRCTGSGRAAG